MVPLNPVATAASTVQCPRAVCTVRSYPADSRGPSKGRCTSAPGPLLRRRLMRNPRRHDRELTYGLDVAKPLGIFQTEMQKGFSSDSRSSLIPRVLDRHTVITATGTVQDGRAVTRIAALSLTLHRSKNKVPSPAHSHCTRAWLGRGGSQRPRPPRLPHCPRSL